MSFRKPIDFLLRQPSIALSIKQALREAVAVKAPTSNAPTNVSDSCSEYVARSKAQSGLLNAQHKVAQATPDDAIQRIATLYGI